MKPLLALWLFTACQLTEQTPSIPWLHGLANPTSSNRASDEVARRIDTWSRFSDVDPDCSGTYPGFEFEADVARNPGVETVLVSLSLGIVVTDSEGLLITETPGYHCAGSADELEAIAAGDAYGARTIAIAATTGGHRESSTWLTLFRVEGRRLDPVFTGTVEVRHDKAVSTGGVFLLPNALVYRPPGGKPSVWIYSSDARAYVEHGQEIDTHHDGPTVSLR
jgi:hypothetical protein